MASPKSRRKSGPKSGPKSVSSLPKKPPGLVRPFGGFNRAASTTAAQPVEDQRIFEETLGDNRTPSSPASSSINYPSTANRKSVTFANEHAPKSASAPTNQMRRGAPGNATYTNSLLPTRPVRRISSRTVTDAGSPIAPETSNKRDITQMPTPPATGKRAAPGEPERSPKRTKTPSTTKPRSPTNILTELITVEQDYDLDDEMHDLHSRLPTLLASDEEIAKDIMEYHQELDLDTTAYMFDHLKKKMRAFGHQYFAFDLTSAEKTAWPLAYLETEYEPLFRVTQYIADGNQNLWRNFFTDKLYRPHLVYGILGEYFKYHIFGATAFGMTKLEQRELEDIDRQYIHYDAFVRSKARGTLFDQQLEKKGELKRQTDLYTAIAKLTQDILTVMKPLLPTFKIPLPKRQGASSPTKSVDISELELSALRTDLAGLIRLAAAIHWGLRLKGKDGDVVRICPHITKGEEFSPWAPQHCINKKRCNDTRSEPYADVLKIKMTCFGRVEVTVPVGPDRLDLEKDYISGLTDSDRVYVEAPARARENAQRRQVADDYSDTDATPQPVIQVRARASIFPQFPEEMQYMYDSESDSEEEGEIRERTDPARGPYVTITQLAPADVYCEWTPEPQNPNGGSNHCPEQYLSLREAVAEARVQAGLRPRDTVEKVFNVASPLLQWSVLALVVAAATGRVPQYLNQYPGVEWLKTLLMRVMSHFAWLKTLSSPSALHDTLIKQLDQLRKLSALLAKQSPKSLAELTTVLQTLPAAAAAELKSLLNTLPRSASALLASALGLPSTLQHTVVDALHSATDATDAIPAVRSAVKEAGQSPFNGWTSGPTKPQDASPAWAFLGFRTAQLKTGLELHPQPPAQAQVPKLARDTLWKLMGNTEEPPEVTERATWFGWRA